MTTDADPLSLRHLRIGYAGLAVFVVLGILCRHLCCHRHVHHGRCHPRGYCLNRIVERNQRLIE